jgi:hypothetical protein
MNRLFALLIALFILISCSTTGIAPNKSLNKIPPEVKSTINREIHGLHGKHFDRLFDLGELNSQQPRGPIRSRKTVRQDTLLAHEIYNNKGQILFRIRPSFRKGDRENVTHFMYGRRNKLKSIYDHNMLAKITHDNQGCTNYKIYSITNLFDVIQEVSNCINDSVFTSKILFVEGDGFFELNENMHVTHLLNEFGDITYYEGITDDLEIKKYYYYNDNNQLIGIDEIQPSSYEDSICVNNFFCNEKLKIEYDNNGLIIRKIRFIQKNLSEESDPIIYEYYTSIKKKKKGYKSTTKCFKNNRLTKLFEFEFDKYLNTTLKSVDYKEYKKLEFVFENNYYPYQTSQ